MRGPGDFAQRRLYGEYLSDAIGDALRESPPGSSLELLPGEVTRARALPGGGFAVEAAGLRVLARTLVLATGNDAAAMPRTISPDLGEALARDPWAPSALDGLPFDAPVVLLGSGLTAIDSLLALRVRGHRGVVHAISRHGQLPRAHAEAPTPPVPPPLPLPRSLRALTRAVREHARAVGWRAAIDGLRPHTAAAWARLGEDDRRRFLRHVRVWWDAHRHRMAPEVANLVEEELALESFHVHAGRVVSAEPSPAGVRVTWTARGTDCTHAVEAARLVNATGASNDLRGTVSPLFESLRDDGLVVPDPLGLGLLCDTHGRVLTQEAALQDDLIALGPLRRGLLWESTAVPELREQARLAAERVAASLLDAEVVDAGAGAGARLS